MNDGENNVATSHEDRYAEVSLKAVELLAKAQRAADDAVAEAQAYARDLETSAREQYKQILLRAQAAAQQVAGAEGARGEAAGSVPVGGVDPQQLAYVRTYARVAHTQLKSVLAALNDELDQLAAMAEGAVPDAPPPGPSARAPEAPGMYGTLPSDPAPSDSSPGVTEASWRPSDPSGPASSSFEATSEPTWPPITPASSSISYFHRGSSWDGPH